MSERTSPGQGRWHGVRGYFADGDPLVAAANLIAIVVAWNQPFYPLYIYWAVSPDMAPAFLTWLSTPLFLAVPAVARWNPTAGKVLLVGTGIANTTLCTVVFGPASGSELFLLPIATLAFLLFRPDERPASIGLATAVLVAFLARDIMAAPMRSYSAEEYAAFLRLNALSAGGLALFIGIAASNVRARPIEPR